MAGGLGVLLALLIGGVVGQLSTVLVYIGLALFLALGLDPIVSLLERKIPRAGAISVVVGAVLLIFAGVLFAIIPVVIEQVNNLVKNLPGMIKDAQDSEWFANLSSLLGGNFDDLVNSALKFVQDPANLLSIGGGVLAVGTGIAGALTGVTIVLILTLYFMAALPKMKKIAARFVAEYRRQRFLALTEEVSGAVGRYVIGQVSLALVNGILSAIFLSIIGAPLPILLALIAFVGSLIPLVGTLSGAIIISLLCLLVSPLTALISAIYYLVYMQIEAYVISPRIMSKAVAVPGAIVVIAAVAGGAVGGILGALVAIPIAASAIIIIQKVVFPAQDRKRRAPADANPALEIEV
ncbi:MAG TPA: AI-2E family transporter [Phycisphaerae bacterium]|nr:AI-2E family transporter [Phycisphaerae bacterium]